MRTALKKLLWGALGLVRNALDPLFNFREVAVLCYHSLSDNEHETAVAPEEFARHMGELALRGFVFVSLADIVAWVKGERALPRKAVAVTFDDGYADFESVAVPLLKKYKAPGAIFAIGEPESTGRDLSEEPPFLTQDALARLRQEPSVEVGYHSRTHPNLAKLSAGEIEKEVAPPLPTRYFAYPGGNHSPAAAQALTKAGYEAAFTIRPVLVRPGMDCMYLPRIVVTKGINPRDIARRASRAADWYKFLTNFT